MYCQWLLLQLNSDILRENPTCVTFTILDICRSVQQVFFCFSYQCKSTPLQVWKDKKSRVASSSSSPPIAPPPPHCGPTSWPSLLRCDVCRSVDGGSSSGRCLSWKMGRCSFFFFSRARPPVFLQLLNRLTSVKGEVVDSWKRSRRRGSRGLSNYVEGSGTQS